MSTTATPAATAANVLPALPTNTAQAALDVALTGEEIAQYKLSLNNSPAMVIQAMQQVIAARMAKINADAQAAEAPGSTAADTTQIQDDNS